MNQGQSKKIKADRLIKLSVSDLRKRGFFRGIVYGDIPMLEDWSLADQIDSFFAYEPVNPEDKVKPYIVNRGTYYVYVSTWNKNASYMLISYVSLQPNGEQKQFGYCVDLVTTPCRYGGLRFWFRCPLLVNGQPCGKRVAKLYKVGNYFGCRDCHNLTYRSRSLSGRYEKLGIINMALVNAAGNPRKWRLYRGKPTRQNIRAMKMIERFNQAVDIFNTIGDIQVKKAIEAADRTIARDKKRHGFYYGTGQAGSEG